MKKIFTGMTAAALLVSAMGMPVFADGLKTVSVDKLQTVGAMEEQRGSMITIRENGKDGWPETISFELKLPSNAKWNSRTLINGNSSVQIDGSSLKFSLKTNKEHQELAYIVPYFDIDRKAQVGDLTVSISSNAKGDKDESVSVAKISDYGVNISSSYQKASKNAKAIPVEITLSESIQNSLLPNQPYAIVFDNASVDAKSIKIEQKSGLDKISLGEVKDNYLEFKIEEKASNINKYLIKLDIVPTKDYIGDISAKFEGKGVEAIETVVAKAEQYINIAQRQIDSVELGKQDQKLSDIVFVENTSSAISEGDYTLKVSPEYKGLVFTSVKLETDASGNIQVNSPTIKGNEIKFKVRGASTIPSKLTFSDLKVTIDRFGYDGEYKLQLIDDKNPDNVLETLTLFTVNAPATTDEAKEVKANSVEFSIGMQSYNVIKDGKTMQQTLEAPPYISAGRTMLPVRAVAESLDMSVDWNAEAKTATLKSKDGQKTIILTLGNKTMLVDGKEIQLDVAPEVKEKRTFLPLRQIAEALSVEISWDNSTKTATILK